jgi:hypothetical protein
MKGFHQVLRLRGQYQDDLLPAGWIEELVAVRRRENASFGATSRCDLTLTLSGDGIHAVLECNLLAGSTLRLAQAWYGERCGAREHQCQLPIPDTRDPFNGIHPSNVCSCILRG